MYLTEGVEVEGFDADLPLDLDDDALVEICASPFVYPFSCSWTRRLAREGR